jgi:hypothetical protein
MSSRAQTAPALAKRLATANPIPLAAPVTTTTLPENFRLATLGLLF